MKGIRVAAWKWGLVTIILGIGCAPHRAARAQSVPPARTVQETPQLENQTLQMITYDNKYEFYGGLASSHFNSGPALVAGTNLGGFDVQGTEWRGPRWGATANFRGYYGTQGVVPNRYGIRGPFVYEYQAMGGLTRRGPHNEHVAVDFHCLLGGVYGVFNSALWAPGFFNLKPGQFGMFNNGAAFATAIGGSLDLNRSAHLALRVSPDYLLTRFKEVNQNEFTISVGILYRFKKQRKGITVTQAAH